MSCFRVPNYKTYIIDPVTVRSRYIFLKNPYKRQPISRPLGRGLGCLLRVHTDLYSASLCNIVSFRPRYNGIRLNIFFHQLNYMYLVDFISKFVYSFIKDAFLYIRVQDDTFQRITSEGSKPKLINGFEYTTGSLFVSQIWGYFFTYNQES